MAVIDMGFWETNKVIVIGDEYADQVEEFVDKAWAKVKKSYPEITEEQFAETMKFCLNRYSKNKRGADCPLKRRGEMKKEEMCQHCGKRKATLNWVGSGGILDFVHGNYQRWCEYCGTEAQLIDAKEKAKEIPKLEKKLARLNKGS